MVGVVGWEVELQVVKELGVEIFSGGSFTGDPNPTKGWWWKVLEVGEVQVKGSRLGSLRLLMMKVLTLRSPSSGGQISVDYSFHLQVLMLGWVWYGGDWPK